MTISACLLGLAVGQLVTGPVSDRYGRSRPLLLGLVAYVVVSALCAVSPSLEVLVAARFVQGAAGGVGLVIAVAAGRGLLQVELTPLLWTESPQGGCRCAQEGPARVQA